MATSLELTEEESELLKKITTEFMINEESDENNDEQEMIVRTIPWRSVNAGNLAKKSEKREGFEVPTLSHWLAHLLVTFVFKNSDFKNNEIFND